MKRQQINITGQVQGVGCRPFIYRLAHKLALTGVVYNDTTGVAIEIQGPGKGLLDFVNLLRTASDKPPLLKIISCEVSDIAVKDDETEFVIGISDKAGQLISLVTCDTATCADCLREMNDEKDFRYRYPFINCTNCGPRYSIVRTIPYDRPNTTMAPFEMCDKCRKQYIDPSDRRFHAQPVACADCGPKIWLADTSGQELGSDTDKVIEKTAEMLVSGKIVAIKGIGGFHLAVNALDNNAVLRLRRRKLRDHKPFAMMAASVEKIGQYAVIDETARQVLQQPQSPIVLLPKKAGGPIAPSVAPEVNTFGFMICYAPLHHLLFAEKGIEVLVMTSANISDEPLICDNDIAIKKLGDIADAFLMHNRDIYRQVDDSIVHIIDNEPAMLRRARGYAPVPVVQSKTCDSDIFAAGSDLKNTFCFVKQNQLILSEHIGDLEDGLVHRHYIDSIEHLRKLFEVKPSVVVCDLHPGYLSTQYAQSLSAEKIFTVQHHWAHIASVLAEYEDHDRVIGLVADGTGYGTDGAVWGCECLIVSLSDFERFGHLAYYPLAGGDKASTEPIRPLLGLLSCCGDDNSYLDKYGKILKSIEPDTKRLQTIATQIEKYLNCVQTSSLGRGFDAVAAVVGLGDRNNFEAQLPMALESIAESSITDTYDMPVLKGGSGKPLQLDFRAMIEQIIEDKVCGENVGVISAKFHNTIASSLLDLAIRAREATNLTTVALSGGVFCNRYLANYLIRMLKANDFSVLFSRVAPANDGGIALGQAAIAAEKTRNE